MATLKNRRDKWYARVIWFVDGKFKERQIPLRTSSKVTAHLIVKPSDMVTGSLKRIK